MCLEVTACIFRLCVLFSAQKDFVAFDNFRINRDNVSDIWSVANSTLNEQLMSICLPTIQEYSEVLWENNHFCSVTQPEGMSIVLNYLDSEEKSKGYSTKAEAFCGWIDNQFSVSDFKQRTYRFRRLLDIIDIETLQADVALVIHARARDFGISRERLWVNCYIDVIIL